MAAPKPPSLDSATSAASAAASAATSAISSAIPSGADIGQFIREQRQHAKLSLRRLAEDTGVSNPYLSQVERGLRKPSAEILQQLAKGLRISAEQLYVQAGLLEDRGTTQALEAAIVSDAGINERQKRVLLDIYASFLTENHSADGVADGSHAGATSVPQAARRPTKRSAKKAAKAAKKSASAPKSSTSTTSRKSSARKTGATVKASKATKTSKTAKTSTRKSSPKRSTSTSTARSTS